MAKIVTFHSYRRGTGRTSILASLSVILARQGKRVGIVDTNIQSPSAHILFKLQDKDIGYTLDNFLWGESELEQTIYDVSKIANSASGRIFLIPSSDNMARIMRVLKEGIDVTLLTSAFSKFDELRDLDFIFLDSSSGITEDILLTMAVADILMVVMRLDEQDYQGVSMILDLAKRLELPRSMVIVNDIHGGYALKEVEKQIGVTFKCEVGGAIPHSDEFLRLASEDIFVLRFPEHPITGTLEKIAAKI
ncbi:MAG: MinD/ParA family protein [Anaerolineae bacterium]|nr:MinD/ParA family protein [Anaerolineae bacterium]MDK1117808.1 MinD/ParA family protein [Anaerolineae bacterium]